MKAYICEARRPIVRVFCLIMEGRADSVPGVKHGVAALVIQLKNAIIMPLLAADRKVPIVRDRALVDLDFRSQELRAGGSNENINNTSQYLVSCISICLVADRPLAGDDI